MNIDDIDQIGVIGAGTMGHGIAQVCATAGYDVVMRDLDQDILEQARQSINVSLSQFAEQDKIDEDPEDVIDRIEITTELGDVSDSQIVIEAVVEQEEIKKEVFRELDGLLSDNAILATNTSSISITELASCIESPERFIGMHFFNPVPLMTLVEVVKGVDTSGETVAFIESISERIGKTPVTVNDFPGFVSNRILCPMLNEAIYALMEGVAGKEEIDDVMKLGMGHPMGPLELADMVGLDVLLNVMEILHEDLGEDKYRPCPLLRKKVEAGHLGKKTGQGFYSYDS